MSAARGVLREIPAAGNARRVHRAPPSETPREAYEAIRKQANQIELRQRQQSDANQRRHEATERHNAQVRASARASTRAQARSHARTRTHARARG